MLSKRVLKERFNKAITPGEELELTKVLLLYEIKDKLALLEPAKEVKTVDKKRTNDTSRKKT